MRKNNAIALLAAILLGSFIFEGCKKRENERFDSSTNNSEALSVFDDVYKVVAEAAEGQPELNKVEVGTWNLQSSISCANVTLTPLGSVFPKTLTVDYGDGCKGTDGRYRKGQVVCVFSGLYRAENTEVMVDLVDYELDNYQITRHHMLITNNGLNGSGQPYFSVVVHNASITNDDGTATWSSTRTRTWVEGSETNWFTADTTQQNGIMGINGLRDDVYHISGTATGTTRSGVPYTVDITDALQMDTCRWVTSGTLVINPQNLDERTIDFGNGDCNEGATLEVNGNTYNFTMW